jgi:hypothetical protein
MKILLTTSVASAWPYIQEMIEELERQGINVKVFDINDLPTRGRVSLEKNTEPYRRLMAAELEGTIPRLSFASSGLSGALAAKHALRLDFQPGPMVDDSEIFSMK